MTAIIIEDEALAARELESILKKLAPEIEIVARQDSVRGSVQWLKENQVDLIFSDVHLGDGRSLAQLQISVAYFCSIGLYFLV